MSNPAQPWMHDRAPRNNNPGNLRPRTGHPPWPGQDGVDDGPGGPFAKFVTPTDGWAALALWCLDARYLRGMQGAVEMISVFAPPSENDTASYAAGVASKVGEGPLNLSQAWCLEALCRAIAHWEESHPVWSDKDVKAGMMLAGLLWPQFRAARTGQPAPKPPPVTETA